MGLTLLAERRSAYYTEQHQQLIANPKRCILFDAAANRMAVIILDFTRHSISGWIVHPVYSDDANHALQGQRKCSCGSIVIRHS